MSIKLDKKIKVITEHLFGENVKKIAYNTGLSYGDVERIINEWEGGYLDVYKDYRDMADLMQELSEYMRKENLTVIDLALGYVYFKLFQDLPHESAMKLINELKRYSKEQREELYKIAEKLVKFSKYKNIEFVKIPDVLEYMEQKGKQLNSEIKEKERHVRALTAQYKTLTQDYETLTMQVKNIEQDLELARKLKKVLNEMSMQKSLENIQNFLNAIKYSDYDVRKFENMLELTAQLDKLRVGREQFTKLIEFLEKVQELGFTIPYIKQLREELEQNNVVFEDYITEANSYILDKLSYIEEVEALKKERKNLELEIKELRKEIKRYMKKIKPKLR